MNGGERTDRPGVSQAGAAPCAGQRARPSGPGRVGDPSGRGSTPRHERPSSVSSYGEDLLIERLLHPGPSGTYVDVGANHPYAASNTYRLYVNGWRGLALDPNPTFAEGFRKVRPGGKYITTGVARTAGSLTYYEYDQHVFNTLSEERAADMLREGTRPIRKRTVPCEPLATIVERELGDTPIDLLNVDVEGLDREVLESLDLRHHRPTVLILEDFGRYLSFLRAEGMTEFERFVRDQGYQPIAQTAWSCILVAEDWRTLFKRSGAFSEERVTNGYLPGQV
ncbi:MAG: FkbM family methyltransferase [Janthinobacterium lividum]